MSIDTSITSDLYDAIQRIQHGVRDFEAMRRACEAMDREREELRQRVGILDVAVDLVRETRDE